MTANASCREIRSVDRQVLDVLRGDAPRTVAELEQALGVTTTAVRQRLVRLQESGLVERVKVPSASRGRPNYSYRLSVDGRRVASADAVDLADAMWREIMSLPDKKLRDRMLQSIAVRLGQSYAADVRGQSIEGKLQSLRSLMEDRHITAEVARAEGLPVLDLHSCPYPHLTDADDERTMCKLEEELISEAMGQPMHLSQCRLDGDGCCQFSPVTDTAEAVS